jgi:Site-specific recombinase XerD
MRRGRRGQGTVYFSKADRRWVARYPLGVVGGTRRAKRVKCLTEREALAELEGLRRTYGFGRTLVSGTVDEYLAEWIVGHARGIRPSTLRSYRGHIKHHIAPLLGGIPVAQLAPRDVRRLVTDMERRGSSPGTIGLVLATLSVALEAAVDERTLPDNAARGVKRPRLNREPVHALTVDEAEAVIAAVTRTWIERPVRVWLGSGLRRGEVMGLDQRDLELDAGFVRVRVSKTTVRAVPISGDAVVALRGALADAPRIGPNEPVFFGVRADARYRRMPGDSISHALPRILEAAGLARATPHALRHGAATLMLSGGASMRAIAEQLGHKNPALTARVYAHVTPGIQRAAVDLLERRQGPG